MDQRGYVQIYTGDGKGKTTAALGLGFRAAGNFMKVFMVQFLKSRNTGELESVKALQPYFQIFRFESVRGFFWALNDEEKAELKKEVDKAYEFICKVLEEESCDVLILDEALGALKNGLLTEEQLNFVIENKPENMELIITGRNAPEGLIEKADLVTEMRPVKHYMDKGVSAREGIEY